MRDMDKADKQRFAALITAASEVYGKPLSAGVIGLYWQALARFSIDEIADALRRHIANPDVGQFMPKPADFVRMIEGSSQDAAALAWSQFDDVLRHVGTWRDVVFPDPIIHRVVQDMGGWISFGTKLEDEWPFVARDFQARYRAYKSRGFLPEYPRRLIGRVNGENASSGYAMEPPVYVGDKGACRLVEQGGKPSGQPIRKISDRLPLVTATVSGGSSKEKTA